METPEIPTPYYFMATSLKYRPTMNGYSQYSRIFQQLDLTLRMPIYAQCSQRTCIRLANIIASQMHGVAAIDFAPTALHVITMDARRGWQAGAFATPWILGMLY